MENEIGKKIRTLRKTRGLTQEQLAEKLNVKRATISNYEIGRRSPHIKELGEIARVLGVGLDYFGVGDNSVLDFVARAKQLFENDDISDEEKLDAYKEIMKLFIKSGEKKK